jgi:hypothetical protein
MLNDAAISGFRASLSGDAIQPSDRRYKQAHKISNR